MNTSPTLLSSRLGDQVVLRWLAFAPGYILQSATNLGPAAVWQNVTTSPPIVNGYYTVTLDPTNAAAFFRLKK